MRIRKVRQDLAPGLQHYIRPLARHDRTYHHDDFMIDWYAELVAQSLSALPFLLRTDRVKALQIDTVGNVLDAGGHADVTQKLLDGLTVGDQGIESVIHLSITAASENSLDGLLLPGGELGDRVHGGDSAALQSAQPGQCLGPHIGQQLGHHGAL